MTRARVRELGAIRSPRAYFCNNCRITASNQKIRSYILGRSRAGSLGDAPCVAHGLVEDLQSRSIVAFFGWHAVRSIGAGPREPKFPFPKPTVDTPIAEKKGSESVVLAGGCFWGVQAVFEHVKGVKSVVAGYSGGHVASPGYEMVSSGLTGSRGVGGNHVRSVAGFVRPDFDGVFFGGARSHAVEPPGT